jgi:transaldolase
VNTSQQLHAVGQSIWYDNIERRLLNNGELAAMIARGEIRGVTSNPTIFMNAVTKSHDYDPGLTPLAKAGKGAEEIFWELAIEDIRAAADLFRPLYEESVSGPGPSDGYVSLEVNPYLANDTANTLSEARRLWKRVDRPNLMVKIPATLEGLPAIRDAIASGINVNVTLIFSRERYWSVMEAYISGLEHRLAAGLPIDTIASVASFFVSRVDTKVDGLLNGMIDRGGARADAAAKSLGQAAIANARLAYSDFKTIFCSERFTKIQAKGGRVQRPLWASTGTKNPAYRDVIYVEELVGMDTVNTVPPATLAAFLDHGAVRANSLEENLPGAFQTLARLEALDISMSDVTRQLEAEGVKSFAGAWKALMEAMETSRRAAVGE